MNFRRFLIIGFLFLLLNPGGVLNAAESSHLKEFISFLKINTDASLDVSEKIVYVNASSAQPINIEREIPLIYRARGSKYGLSVSHISVTDETDRPLAFHIEDLTTGKKISIRSEAQPDETKTYIIKYKIKRAINYFEKYDELSWNVTGDKWPVSIEKATVKVVLPDKTARENLGALCFAGDFGGKDSCSSATYEGDQAGVSTISFSRSNLPVGGNMNVVVKIPAGMVYRPTFFETFWLLIKDNLIFFFPALVFLFMFLVWEEKGKAPKGSGIIAEEFDVPKLLTPLELDAVLHEKTHPRAWAAEIIYLATQGHLMIERMRDSSGATAGGYILNRLEGETKLSASDEELLRLLFAEDDAVAFPSSQVGAKAYARISQKTWRGLVEKGYFPPDAQKVRRNTAILYVLIVTLGFLVAFAYLKAPFGAYDFLFLFLSILIVLFFALVMPYHLNDKVLMKDKIFGFKNHLSGFKKCRAALAVKNRTAEEFEAWLPYALALGVEKKWARQFSEVSAVRLSWYHTSISSKDLTPLALVYHLGDFMRGTAAAARDEIKAAPRKPDFWEK